MQTQEGIAPEAVASTLHKILTGPEFTEERTLWDDVWDWIAANFEFDLVLPLEELFRWFLIAFLILSTVVYATLWIRNVRAAKRSAGIDRTARTPALDRARRLAEKAREARRQGESRKALRLYLFALLVGSSRRGGLKFHEAWTNRELLRRGEPSKRVRRLLNDIVVDFEPKEFGRGRIQPEDLDRLEGLVANEINAPRGRFESGAGS
ncbi:MAG: hypothetical protein CMJ89_07355 [Planctomycetes bacterium]|jgi:hypothetical protein|nr:hypothetical protein [Planctomycetota bacterium]